MASTDFREAGTSRWPETMGEISRASPRLGGWDAKTPDVAARHAFLMAKRLSEQHRFQETEDLLRWAVDGLRTEVGEHKIVAGMAFRRLKLICDVLTIPDLYTIYCLWLPRTLSLAKLCWRHSEFANLSWTLLQNQSIPLRQFVAVRKYGQGSFWGASTAATIHCSSMKALFQLAPKCWVLTIQCQSWTGLSAWE